MKKLPTLLGQRLAIATAAAFLTMGAAQPDSAADAEAVRVLRTLRDPAHPPVEELAIDFERHAKANPVFLFEILESR